MAAATIAKYPTSVDGLRPASCVRRNVDYDKHGG
jgi:hypothetical protein